MPDGVVTWYDPNLGRGVIEASSGRYLVTADDMAPKARVQGARIYFDIQRDDLHDRAVNVSLREGTHHHPSQRRFGHSQPH
jgi:cold shock CspA family protein